MTVPRLGPKAFEQCAGFLRIRGGDDPLDASGVHPESYPVVRRILAKTGTGVASSSVTRQRSARSARRSSPTRLRPAHGQRHPEGTGETRPRPAPGVPPATFAEGVHTLDDLEPGMVLEGVVTNVAAFGAFVDVGVHQDGLVHVSAMSAGFVSDPRSVAKPGDVVRVKVLSVDTARQRISLTMRLDDGAARSGGSPVAPAPHHPERKPPTPDPPLLQPVAPPAVQAPPARAHARPAMTAVQATTARPPAPATAATPPAPTTAAALQAATAPAPAPMTVAARHRGTTIPVRAVTTSATPAPTTSAGRARAMAGARSLMTGGAARPRRPAARWPRPSAGRPPRQLRRPRHGQAR